MTANSSYDPKEGKFVISLAPENSTEQALFASLFVSGVKPEWYAPKSDEWQNHLKIFLKAGRQKK